MACINAGKANDAKSDFLSNMSPEIWTSLNGLPLKIIAMTANNQAEEIEYCKQIGMDDFLSKPFTTNEALEVIHAVFES